MLSISCRKYFSIAKFHRTKWGKNTFENVCKNWSKNWVAKTFCTNLILHLISVVVPACFLLLRFTFDLYLYVSFVFVLQLSGCQRVWRPAKVCAFIYFYSNFRFYAYFIPPSKLCQFLFTWGMMKFFGVVPRYSYGRSLFITTSRIRLGLLLRLGVQNWENDINPYFKIVVYNAIHHIITALLLNILCK